jgi:hypothetical protein
MPIAVGYTDVTKGVVLTASGRTTGTEFISVTNQLLDSSARTQHIRYALVNLSDVAEFDMSADKVRQVVALVRKSSQFNRHAVIVAIVATQRVVLGLARMWELMVDWVGWKIRVCSSLSEAENWVGEELARQDSLRFANGGF